MLLAVPEYKAAIGDHGREVGASGDVDDARREGGSQRHVQRGEQTALRGPLHAYAIAQHSFMNRQNTRQLNS